MKKAICAIMAVMLCCFIFTACNNNHENSLTDYVRKSGRCIVTMPEDYHIVYENNGEYKSPEFDEDLYNADTVNGKPKKEGINYFSVLCNVPFRILTPLGIIQDRNENSQTLVYWKLNDTLYKDSDGYYSENTFSCSGDTEITPLYYEFRPVGIILLEINENGTPILTDSEIFDTNGEIKTQDGVHYLYGVYDFEPHREFWRTNLMISEFNVSYMVKPFAINFCKRVYTIDVKIKKSTVFNNGNILVETLCKIDGHGYTISKRAGEIIKTDLATIGTLNCSIGEHQIKYSFVD